MGEISGVSQGAVPLRSLPTASKNEQVASSVINAMSPGNGGKINSGTFDAVFSGGKVSAGYIRQELGLPIKSDLDAPGVQSAVKEYLNKPMDQQDTEVRSALLAVHDSRTEGARTIRAANVGAAETAAREAEAKATAEANKSWGERVSETVDEVTTSAEDLYKAGTIIYNDLVGSWVGNPISGEDSAFSKAADAMDHTPENSENKP